MEYDFPEFTISTTTDPIVAEKSKELLVKYKKIFFNLLIQFIKCNDSRGVKALSYHVRCIEVKLWKEIVNMDKIDDKWIDGPLIEAIKVGNLDIIKILLEKNASIHNTSKDNGSVFCVAASLGQKNIAEFLFDYLDDFPVRMCVHTKRDLIGYLPLHHAAKEGHLEFIKFLIAKRKANIGNETKEGNKALHVAAMFGHEDIITYFLQLGQSVDEPGFEKYTPLHFAALNGRENIVHFLVEKGADINAITSKGETALHFAAQNGNNRIVKFLVKKGADIYVKSTDNETILHFAIKYGKETIAQYLFDQGFNVDCSGYDNLTPVHYAAKLGNLNMVYVLKNNGADIYAKHKKGVTALHFAAVFGHINIVDFFLNKGQNVDDADDDNWTPLHHAACGGYIEAIRFLVTKGANIFAVTRKGGNALHIAAMEGHKNAVVYFISQGLNVNTIHPYANNTPLHFAAKYGHLEVVRYLIEKGADADILNKYRCKAIHLAREKHHWSVVIFLEKHTQLMLSERLVKITKDFANFMFPGFGF